MISDELFSSVCGPPIAANTAISKDVGIYSHSLTPSWAVKASFKKSSAPVHCLALSDTHVYAAQDQKAHVHVYSRARGNQEALIPFPERIRCLALAGQVLIVGTIEGRLILWETCSGRQITTPPCHVQAISCIAVSSHHVLSASDDSNINIWSLARLLEPSQDIGHEPDRTLSNHRAAIIDLALGPSSNPDTNLCVSASKDKTCIIWNYQTGQVLRTLLFPSSPLCISLDPSARALFVASDDGGVYMIDFFGDKPLLGSRSAELASIVVQVNSPLGVADEDTGSTSCLAVSYDGTFILTGHTKGKILKWNLVNNSHPMELTNLNAWVTNLIFAPLLPAKSLTRAVSIVKPNQAQRQYNLTTQLEGDLESHTRFSMMIGAKGFSTDIISRAMESIDTSTAAISDENELRRRNEELQEIIKEQQALHKATLDHYGETSAS